MRTIDLRTRQRGVGATLPLIAGLALLGAACASTPEADIGPRPAGPEDCHLVAVGPVRIPSERGEISREELQARGLVALRDSRNIYEVRRMRGRTERVHVAVQGTGFRWNHSACASLVRQAPESDGWDSYAIRSLLDGGGNLLVPVNDTWLWVHREGSGPPAIVVHGGPVLDHTYLQEHLGPLGASLELTYFDQRLSGRSVGEVDSASVRLDTFVEDIEGLRALLGPERVHLIGHSWGGLLALKYAIAHPERLHSLVLLSPNPPSASLWREEQEAEGAALQPADTAGLGAIRQSQAFQAGEPEAIERALRLSFRSLFHTPALAERLNFHIPEDHAARSRQFGYMLPDLMAYDLTDRLADLRVPTLVVYGEEEPGARIGGAVLAERLPDVTLVTLPEAGHFPFLETPDAFFRVVRGFLERVGE